MGACCTKTPEDLPKVDIDVTVKGNRCFNFKRLLCCKGATCCDCDNDSCTSNCCTTTIVNELEHASQPATVVPQQTELK